MKIQCSIWLGKDMVYIIVKYCSKLFRPLASITGSSIVWLSISNAHSVVHLNKSMHPPFPR